MEGVKKQHGKEGQMKRQRWCARAVLPIALVCVAAVTDGREQIYVALSSDATSYAPGDTVHVTADVTDGGGSPVSDVTKTKIVGSVPHERGELHLLSA